MAKHRYVRIKTPRRYIINYYKWFWYCKARPVLRRAIRQAINVVIMSGQKAIRGNKRPK